MANNTFSIPTQIEKKPEIQEFRKKKANSLKEKIIIFFNYFLIFFYLTNDHEESMIMAAGLTSIDLDEESNKDLVSFTTQIITIAMGAAVGMKITKAIINKIFPDKLLALQRKRSEIDQKIMELNEKLRAFKELELSQAEQELENKLAADLAYKKLALCFSEHPLQKRIPEPCDKLYQEYIKVSGMEGYAKVWNK